MRVSSERSCIRTCGRSPGPASPPRALRRQMLRGAPGPWAPEAGDREQTTCLSGRDVIYAAGSPHWASFLSVHALARYFPDDHRL